MYNGLASYQTVLGLVALMDYVFTLRETHSLFVELLYVIKIKMSELLQVSKLFTK
jgi:hypothetical protein